MESKDFFVPYPNPFDLDDMLLTLLAEVYEHLGNVVDEDGIWEVISRKSGRLIDGDMSLSYGDIYDEAIDEIASAVSSVGYRLSRGAAGRIGG